MFQQSTNIGINEGGGATSILTRISISERDNINVAILVLPWSSRYNKSVVSSLLRYLWAWGYVLSSGRG